MLGELSTKKETHVKVESTADYIPAPHSPIFRPNQSTGLNFGLQNIGNYEADHTYVMGNIAIHDSAVDHQNPRKNLTTKNIEDEVFGEVKSNEPKPTEYPTESIDPGDKKLAHRLDNACAARGGSTPTRNRRQDCLSGRFRRLDRWCRNA